jgi:hypothetical protein
MESNLDALIICSKHFINKEYLKLNQAKSIKNIDLQNYKKFILFLLS